MKKLFTLATAAALFGFIACGEPAAEENTEAAADTEQAGEMIDEMEEGMDDATSEEGMAEEATDETMEGGNDEATDEAEDVDESGDMDEPEEMEEEAAE